MTIKCITEYRINGKKGCECFRTESFEQLMQKLEELQEQHPNIDYKTQVRFRYYDGKTLRVNYLGLPEWSCWD